jgi:hypothetical protein
MKALRWILAAIWILAFFTGRAVSDVSWTVSDVAGRWHLTAAPVSNRAPTPPGQQRPNGLRIDLYGNPIDEAVTDYRVDPRGELYERHAPDTAVLKLPSAGA